jgi:hypothetical protein
VWLKCPRQLTKTQAALAQLAERCSRKAKVSGSIPESGSLKTLEKKKIDNYDIFVFLIEMA